MIYAVLVATALTIIICLVEVPSKSKAGLKACCCFPSYLYLIIFIFGNVAATLLTPHVMSKVLPASLMPWDPFMYGFFGVFAFHFIFSNINVTFLKKGVLTIDDWIAKARDYAVASAVNRAVTLTHQRTEKLKNFLCNLSELTLNTYISQYLGSDRLKKIQDDIASQNNQYAIGNPNVDAKLYKALTLATEKPNEIDALMRKSK